MDKLKAFLTKNGIAWRSLDQWALVFSGNHPEGIIIEQYIPPEHPVRKKIKALNLYSEHRGFEYHLYVAPVQT